MKQVAAVQLVGNAAALLLGYYRWASVKLASGLLGMELHGGLGHGLALPMEARRGLGLWARPQGRAVSSGAAASARAAGGGGRGAAALRIAPVAKLQEACSNPAFRLASWLTLKLRKPVKPAAVLRIFNGVWWVVRWVAVPMLLRPWILAVAEFGWRGLAPSRLPKRVWSEWCLTPLLLLCALWLPFRLLGWRPLMSGFGLEMASFIVRILIAYLLFAGGLLALEGMPLFTQRKTAVSP